MNVSTDWLIEHVKHFGGCGDLDVDTAVERSDVASETHGGRHRC